MHYLPEFDCDIPDLDLLTLMFDSPFCWAKNDTILFAEAADASNCVTKCQAATLIRRLAYILRTEFGVGAIGSDPTVVTVMSSNQVMLPIVFYAVIAAGGIYSAASTGLTSGELTRQMEQSCSRLILTSDETAQTAAAAALRCRIAPNNVLVLQSSNHQRALIAPSSNRTIDILRANHELQWDRITNPETLSHKTIALLFSSGTTGTPKGVQLSHSNFVAEAIITQATLAAYLSRTNRHVHINFHYRVIAHLPPAHIAGAQGYFINGIMAGGTVFCMPKFILEDFVHAAKQHAITFLTSVPAVFLRIAKSTWITDEFRTLLHAESGAAPMGPELQGLAEAKLKCDITQAWGLTETTGAVTLLPWDRADATGSISQLLPNTRMKIVGEDDVPVREGERGEILLRGPNITSGYYENPAATKEAFTADGWFRTGDIGVRRDGKFYIVDRKKELIKYKGLQIAPAEIEALLLGHPEIIDAAVIGIPDPTVPGSEIPRAFVVRRGGSKITSEDVKKLVQANLAAHKQLRGGVEFIDQVPRTISGKILRRMLRETAKKDGKGKL